MSEDITSSAAIIRESNHLVALTGAGISKESNVPTFRGEDGLWKEYDAMDLATPSGFRNDPELVWEWYSWRQGLIAGCEPNPAHLTLAKWEEEGLLNCVITQNVDGLHHRAGSENILEVHGDIWAVKCTTCDYHSRLDEPADGVPLCQECGSILRPDVVWFGESLDGRIMNQVYLELEKADACLVIGTSGIVQPAASFPLMVKKSGGSVIEVNIERTPLTSVADLYLEGKAGSILPRLDSMLKQP
ncbi:MAG: NAD-dependent deacylase [Candidatus Thorarchaeota archaeon]